MLSSFVLPSGGRLPSGPICFQWLAQPSTLLLNCLTTWFDSLRIRLALNVGYLSLYNLGYGCTSLGCISSKFHVRVSPYKNLPLFSCILYPNLLHIATLYLECWNPFLSNEAPQTRKFCPESRPGSDAECLNFSAPDLWWRHWLWRLAECVLLSGLMGVVMLGPCFSNYLIIMGKTSNLAIRVYIWVIYRRWSKYLLVVLVSWFRSPVFCSFNAGMTWH